MFDIRTIIVLTFGLSVVLVLGMALLAWSARRYQGVGLWALANGAFLLAYATVLMRGRDATLEVPLALVTNLAWLAGMLLYGYGVARFLGARTRSRTRRLTLVVAPTLALYLWFLLAEPDLGARVVVISACTTVLALEAVSLLVRRAPANLRRVARPAAAAFGMFGALNAIRAAGSLVGGGGMFAPTIDALQQAVPLIALFALLLVNGGLTIMVVQRLLNDLHVADSGARALEERLGNILGSIDDVIFSLDARSMAPIYVSPASTQAFGVTPDELLVSPGRWAEIIHEDDRDQTLAVLAHALESRQRGDLLCRCYGPDGAERWIHARFAGVYDSDGAPLRLDGILTDITEERRLEQALREREALFRMTFDQTPIGAVMVGLDDRYLRVNEAFCAFTGYAQEQLIGRSFLEITHPADVGANDAERARLDSGDVAHYQIKKRYLRADGRTVWAAVTIRLVYDEHGAPRYYLCLVEDIDARIQAEEAARTTEARYRAVVEDQTDLICRYTPDGTLTFVSGAYCRAFGYIPSSVLGTSFLDLISPERQAAAVVNISALTPADPVRTSIAHTILADARQVWLEWTDRGFFDSAGRLVEVQAVGRDVTVRVQAEQALREAKEQAEAADRSKSAFLATMSHELRTPLSTILGSAELLQSDPDDALTPRQQTWLGRIERSGRHLLALINDILAVARIEAGQEQLTLQPVDVAGLCEQSMRSVRALAAEKQIQLALTYAPELGTLLADERRLVQVLGNLLSNALKFTPVGGRAGLEVAADARAQELAFTVWDTGAGIAPERLDELFQPFRQLDSRLARAHEGTGLGLVLVKQLTQLHGGRVAVESEVGAGSRFTVTLPWRRPEPRRAAPEPGGGADEPAAARGFVLVVDDDDVGRAMVTEYLAARGYVVRCADGGDAALALVARAQPSAILMDVQMPHLDGLEVIRRIRAHPQHTAVPIIALTALAMPGDRERCLAAGANAYLSKPARLHEVAELIARLA